MNSVKNKERSGTFIDVIDLYRRTIFVAVGTKPVNIGFLGAKVFALRFTSTTNGRVLSVNIPHLMQINTDGHRPPHMGHNSVGLLLHGSTSMQ